MEVLQTSALPLGDGAARDALEGLTAGVQTQILTRSPRRRQRGRGRGLAVHRVRLHQLDPRAIRIEEVHLALAVDAGADLDRARVGLARGPGLELRDRLRGVRHEQTEMMRGAAAVRR